jgi:hypothetical protein
MQANCKGWDLCNTAVNTLVLGYVMEKILDRMLIDCQEQRMMRIVVLVCWGRRGTFIEAVS